MKKLSRWILTFILLWFWAIFAQNILPDSAEIEVKDTIMEWEAANLSVTMMKNGSKMSNYEWTIYFTIEEENWNALKNNEYTLPNGAIYTFLPTDLWSKEFQKWLEIKKEWTFYIQVEDLNDPDEKILWKQQMTVIKNATPKWDYHVEIYSPQSEWSITNDKVDILANIPELPNSKALIYVDNDPWITVDVDSTWIINYSIWNMEVWRHNLRIEVPDIDWSILWTSDTIYFNVVEWISIWIKDVTVYPEKWLMVWDKTKITVYTDEMVESVQMKLSDRPDSDNLILTKDWLWEFSYNLYLTSTGDINISLETFAANNSASETHENVKKISVIETPEITNITTIKDEEKQSATISWETVNWDPITSYTIKYRAWAWTWNWTWNEISWEEQTDKKSFTFTDVPYDTEINLTVTPNWKNALNLPTHWTASKTIQFIITKPSEEPLCWNGVVDEWEDCTTCPEDLWEQCQNHQPRCTVQNIATRTTKIWDNYYLIWDKIENVTKYIVYSSTSPDGLDKVKVYETSDTSYEYPFDYNAKEEQFMYFRIVWICDDGEEIELTWATKIQVWPAENFFLLLCLTFLIYFWIKLFRETEA